MYTASLSRASLLTRPGESGRPGLIEAPAGPTDPAGLRPGESGTPGLINVLAPGRLARAKDGARGFGAQPAYRRAVIFLDDLVSMF
jgi:hypothetical protein